MSNENFITRELIERLIAEGGGAGRLNFSGQKLERLDLSYLDLSRADLSRANLTGVSLTSARLRGAKLIEANLAGAELNDADFSAADLLQADLHGANLTGAILRNAYLVDANLEGAKLIQARLPDADLRGARLAGADVSEADLSGVELSGLDLTGLIWQSAGRMLPDLRGTNFYKTRLTAAQAQLLADSEANLDGVEVAEEALSLPTGPTALARRLERVGPLYVEFVAATLTDLNSRLTALNSLYTRAGLLVQGRLADLLDAEAAAEARFEREAALRITDLTFQAGVGLVNLTFEPEQPLLRAALAEALGSLNLNQVLSRKEVFLAVRLATATLIDRLDPTLDEQTRPLVVARLLPTLLRFNAPA